MAASVNLMADVEGVNMQESSGEDIKNEFAYHNNVHGAAKHIRLGFLRKVYSLLALQLIMTTLIAGVCLMTPQVKGFVHENPWLLMIAFILSMGLLIALHVKRRETPVNLILLAGFVSVFGTLINFLQVVAKSSFQDGTFTYLGFAIANSLTF